LDARFITAGIGAIPTVTLQVNGHKTVQTKGAAGVVESQALVAESRGDSARAKERHEEVAFRETEACAMLQHLRRRTGDHGNGMVGTVAHVLSHPEEAAACHLLVILSIAGQLGGQANNAGSVAVNDGRGLQELGHGVQASILCSHDGIVRVYRGKEKR
jgi:hypothetical protein